MHFFHRHWRFIGLQGKGGEYLYSSLPLPPAHENLDIYLQFCISDDYHVFLFPSLVTTRLVLAEIYHLIKWQFSLIDDGMLTSMSFIDDFSSFSLQQFDIGNLGIWTLASTFTLVWQEIRLAKCPNLIRKVGMTLSD